MLEREFRDTLDAATTCPGCGREIQVAQQDWRVAPFKPQPGQWVAVCFVHCPHCPWKKAAAAGSSEEAHVAAQAIRSQLLKAMGV